MIATPQSDAQSLGHVAIASVIFLFLVSAVFSLLVVSAIGLQLLLDPEKRTRANSFNVYLIFLSSADLIGTGVGVFMWQPFYSLEWDGTESLSAMLGRTFYTGPYHWSLISSALIVTITEVLVACICHEILKLLRNSKQRRRCKPPALRKAFVQGFVACAAGVVNAVVMYYSTNRKRDFLIVLSMLAVPIVYSLWVVFRIVREGLIRTGAQVGNRLRVLVVYFARIILVYCVMMCCMGIVIVLAMYKVGGYDLFFATYTGTVLGGLQGWINFAVVVTKPDVRKMVLDLLTGRMFHNNSNRPTSISNNRGERDLVSIPERTTRDSGGVAGERANSKRNHEQVSSEFIVGIVDYLSDDEGGDGDEEAGIKAGVEGGGDDDGNLDKNGEGIVDIESTLGLDDGGEVEPDCGEAETDCNEAAVESDVESDIRGDLSDKSDDRSADIPWNIQWR